SARISLGRVSMAVALQHRHLTEGRTLMGLFPLHAKTPTQGEVRSSTEDTTQLPIRQRSRRRTSSGKAWNCRARLELEILEGRLVPTGITDPTLSLLPPSV